LPVRQPLAYLHAMLGTVRLGTSAARAAAVMAPSQDLILRLFPHSRKGHDEPHSHMTSRSIVRSLDALELHRPTPVQTPEEFEEMESKLAISYAPFTPRRTPKKKIAGSPYVGNIKLDCDSDIDDEDEDDQGHERSEFLPRTPVRFRTLLTPGFDIYVDTPLRSANQGPEHNDVDERGGSEADSSDESSPDGRIPLGRIRDENLLWTTWRLGPLEA